MERERQMPPGCRDELMPEDDIRTIPGIHHSLTFDFSENEATTPTVQASNLEVERELAEMLSKDGLSLEQIKVEIMRFRFRASIESGGFARLVAKHLSDLVKIESRKHATESIENFSNLRQAYQDQLVKNVSDDLLRLFTLNPFNQAHADQIKEYLGLSADDFIDLRGRFNLASRTTNDQNVRAFVRNLLVELPGKVATEVSGFCKINKGSLSNQQAFVQGNLCTTGVTSMLSDMKEFNDFIQAEKTPIAHNILNAVHNIIGNQDFNILSDFGTHVNLPVEGEKVHSNLRMLAKIIRESVIKVADHNNKNIVQDRETLFGALLLASIQLRAVAVGGEKTQSASSSWNPQKIITSPELDHLTETERLLYGLRDMPINVGMFGFWVFFSFIFLFAAVLAITSVVGIPMALIEPGFWEGAKITFSGPQGVDVNRHLPRIKRKRYEKALKIFSEELGYGSKKETEKMIQSLWVNLYGTQSDSSKPL